jgi:hypothetical protein
MEHEVNKLLDWFAQAQPEAAVARIERLAQSEVPEQVTLAVLIALLRHDDARLRLAAVAALGALGPKAGDAVAELERVLNTEPGAGASLAAAALWRIGTPSALAAIEHLKTGDGQYDFSAASDNSYVLRQYLPPVDEAKKAAEFSIDDIDEELRELLRSREEAPPPAPAPPAPAPGRPQQHQNAPPPAAAETGFDYATDRQTSAPPEPEMAEETRREAPAEAAPRVDTAQFTAYYPREVVPGEWQPLQAYVYTAGAADDVLADAQKQLHTLDDFRAVGEAARQPIAEGALITATPYLDGFQFNPPSITVGFYEDWHGFSFKLRAKDAPLYRAANGFLTFTIDSLIVADIPLAIFVTDQPAQRAPAATDPRPVYDAVFASYSRQDMTVVERIERAAKALGLAYLRDMISLRSGEDWNAGLLTMIDQATIFQLFWSPSAAASPYVRQEWEYAISLNRQHLSFIRPVYWSQPMPPPPPPLAHIHFAYQPDLVN